MPVLISERQDDIAILTLNRPEARNALSLELIDAVLDELAKLAGDRTVRSLVLTGSGEQAFCAGADLKERLGLAPDERTEHTRKINAISDALAGFPVPVVAAIRGFALAGGAELAVACDLRVFADDSIYGLPEVNIGVFPGAGATVRLPGVVGSGHARDLLFTGRRITAQEAAAMGLADRVVPSSDVLVTAMQLAGTIANGAPLAVRALKAALDQSVNLPPAEAARIVSRLRAPLDATDDYSEGIRAFTERRSPRFTGT